MTINLQHEEFSLSDITPLTKFAEDCEGKGIATKNQLRWWLRFREENGLSDAVAEIYGRLYIIEPRFVKWMVSQTTRKQYMRKGGAA